MPLSSEVPIEGLVADFEREHRPAIRNTTKFHRVLLHPENLRFVIRLSLGAITTRVGEDVQPIMQDMIAKWRETMMLPRDTIEDIMQVVKDRMYVGETLERGFHDRESRMTSLLGNVESANAALIRAVQGSIEGMILDRAHNVETLRNGPKDMKEWARKKTNAGADLEATLPSGATRQHRAIAAPFVRAERKPVRRAPQL